MQVHPTRRALLALGVCASAVVSVGCFTSDEGLAPPLGSFYYPTGVAVSPGGTALYVASSDFDLQYSGGTVHALDLTALRGGLVALRAALETERGSSAACATLSLGANENPILNPGPCAPIDAKPFIARSATIGAFASGAIVTVSPDGPGARLFVPVRGDPSVTFFTLTDDRDGVDPSELCAGVTCLECEASGDERRCGAGHRVGEDPSSNLRGLTLPVEPVGIAATDDSSALVVAHQTTNQASLITNPFNDRPTLQFTLSQLPDGPTEVGGVPTPAYAKQRASDAGFEYRPSFLVTFRSSPEIDLLRFNDDDGSNPPRPFINRVFAEGISVNAGGQDSRGIAVDASERQRCEGDCGDDRACLEDCLAIPVRVFVANRAPPSLLIGEVETQLVDSGQPEPTAAFDTVDIFDTVPLSTGASKVAVGHVIDDSGELAVRVFAVAFDSRLIFVYDPDARRIESIIRTGRGPHAIAFDTGVDGADPPNTFSMLLVGHFTDSYIGVVDLDMRNPHTFGEMFATVGEPIPPAEAN